MGNHDSYSNCVLRPQMHYLSPILRASVRLLT